MEKLVKDLDLSYRAKSELSEAGIIHTASLACFTEETLLERGVSKAVTSELKCYEYIPDVK